MTLQEIEVFLNVARTGSVCAAAQSLYITQPAVSRHLNALERELDCTLFRRGRGKRQVELTDQGRDFVPAAEKLRHAFQEAMEVPRGGGEQTLRVSSIGSLSSYLLPGVFRTFLGNQAGQNLVFHQMTSAQSYEAVSRGEMDLALISDDMYHAQVETIPLFREPMLLLAGTGCDLDGSIHPSALDPAKEVRLPWNPEYDLWHSFWFRSGARPRIVVNQMSLLEAAFSWGENWGDSWAVAPALVARVIAEKTGAHICTLAEGPPEEIVYYLLGRRRKPALVQTFLDCLRRELTGIPDVKLYP